MKFFRNPEIIKTLIWYTALSAAAAAAAFIWDAAFGIFTFALCILFIFLYIAATYRRYRKIYDLCADVDRILHGDDADISLEEYSEGELGILISEIHKMTLRLREQRHRLLDDKIYLADSLADISHQIRTPLTSTNLLTQLLLDPDIGKERRVQLTHKLSEMLSRIERLVTALLKISRLDAGAVRFQKETVKMEELIRQATSVLSVPIELRGQCLVVNAEGTVECDSSWTTEAIENIVKNCMEHTARQGRIEIKASENALYSQITVSDNGTGIDREDLPHIFERFYKGKNSDHKNFGIGLALSRMIITGQNGTIKVQNQKEKGALFTIRFYKGTI